MVRLFAKNIQLKINWLYFVLSSMFSFFFSFFLSVPLGENWVARRLHPKFQRAEGLFVCLFVWAFSSYSRIFHSYRDFTITSDGLQILTCARHSWPLSSEGSLACHAYCDTGHPFLMVISEDPWHTPIAKRLTVELSLPAFKTKVCHGWDSNTQPSTCGANTLTHCATRQLKVRS